MGMGFKIGIYIGSKLGSSSTLYGNELVVNYNFATNTNWINNGATLNFSVGELEIVTSSIGGAYQAITTEIGKTYRAYSLTTSGPSPYVLRVNNGTVPSASPIVDLTPSLGVIDGTFVAVGTSTCIYMRNGVGGSSFWQLVSVKEVL